jgi:hypothetical protein
MLQEALTLLFPVLVHRESDKTTSVSKNVT